MKKTFFFSLIVITIISLLSCYSATSINRTLFYRSIFLKHLIWLALGWLIFLLLNFKRLHLYEYSLFLYILGLILLLLVLFFGKSISGSQRWIRVGPLSFQPSEFMKLSLILFLAFWYHRYFERIGFFISSLKILLKELVLPLSFILPASFLVFLEPDLGTSLFYLILFICLYFSLPLRKRYIISFLAISIIIAPLIFPHLKDYQKKRLIVFLDPGLEPLGAGYTIIQTKIAIGSGGLWGKGFLSGTQGQLNFLPERHTDFIFGVYAEEWGFTGCLLLLLLYLFMLRYILSVKEKCFIYFERIYILGVFLYFFLQITINIFMTLGLLPVVGLPLPFLSYGGTHLILEFFLLGTVASLDRRWKV